MSRRTKFVLAAGAAAVVLAALGVASWSMSGGEGEDTDRQAMAGMEGMQDVEEMESSRSTGGMEGMSTNGSIRLSSGEISSFGITFDVAAVRTLEKRIRAAGFVDFDETRMAYVAPKFGGWVERLHVDFTGRSVRRGEPLLEVYSPELVTAQEELLLAARMTEAVEESRAENVSEGARDLLESARRRLDYWDISPNQIERLLETGEVTKTLTLYAPVSGVVMEKDAFEGQAFQSGRNLYMIADLSEVWVNAEIFESDIAFVQEGMPAEITVAARPGETLSGTVEYVYPTLSERTRSMRARIAIPNPRGELKPGMYATAGLTVGLGETLTIPTSAMLRSGERAVAFVDMGDGELMPHELRLGARGEGFVQVLEGLEPGQRVVTSAQFLLDSESNLAEVMQAMMAQVNMSDMEGTDMDGMDVPAAPDTTEER